MDWVEPGELGRGQLDQASPDARIGPVDRYPAAVAVDERRHAVGPVPDEQAADLTSRQAQDPSRCRAAAQDGGGRVGRCLHPAWTAGRLVVVNAEIQSKMDGMSKAYGCRERAGPARPASRGGPGPLGPRQPT